MEKILVLLILAAMVLLCYIIFKKGIRSDSPEAKDCMKGCMGCGAAEFCNDVKRFSELAERKSSKEK